MRPNRQTVLLAVATYLAMALILGIAVLFGSGCGAGARNTAIKAALTSTDVARDGFIAYDGKHQTDIVNNAKTLDEGKRDLEAYRARRAKIVDGFTLVYHAIASAAAVDNKPSLATMQAAVVQLIEDLKEFEAGQ